MTVRRFFAILSVILGVSPILADPIYSWEDSEGVISFTDDKSKVPDIYKEGTVVFESNQFKGYEFLTVEIPNDEARKKRLNSLREDSNK